MSFRNQAALFLTGLFFFFHCFPVSAQEAEEAPTFFVDKGRAFVTLTFSLDQRKAENENQLLRNVIDQNRVNYRISANGGYALIDNLTLGLGVSYGRGKEDITFLDDNGNEITSRLQEQNVTFVPNMRNYVPFGKGNFQIFVQTSLRLTIGESLERVFRVDNIDKIEGEYYEVQLGVQPGALLFFDRHWSFEVSVGLAGLSSRVTTTTVNEDEENRTRVVRNNIDLKVDLLALNLGVAYYF